MTRNGFSLKRKFFPESDIGGFSNSDGTFAFFSHIASLINENSTVLEFGAGRGANVSEVKSEYLRNLQNFKGRCAKVVGCDIDEAVLDNPYLDEAHVISPNAPLPFADETFDIIVSSWVFEHIEHPDVMARELLRITKPGGYICACTPNKFGYVSIMSRIVSNRNHARFLSKIQPERKELDIFPTAYKLNTERDVNRKFSPDGEVIVGRTFSEPAYHFNNAFLYAAFLLIHKILPLKLSTTLHIYIRKKFPDSRPNYAGAVPA